MFKVAICDDEIDFLNEFQELIVRIFDDKKASVTVTIFQSGAELISCIEKEHALYDIIFLDVDMPCLNGFQTAEKLRDMNISSYLIFTTFMEQHVRNGYLYDAYRYVFKRNLKKETTEAVSSILCHQQRKGKVYTLKYRNSGVLDDLNVKSDDILYFKMEKTRRVLLKTIFGEYELLTKPLSYYQKMVNSSFFLPVLRNYILNFEKIADMDKEFFIMEDGSKISLGFSPDSKRTSRKKYVQYLKERMKR